MNVSSDWQHGVRALTEYFRRRSCQITKDNHRIVIDGDIETQLLWYILLIECSKNTKLVV